MTLQTVNVLHNCRFIPRRPLKTKVMEFTLALKFLNSVWKFP